MHYEYTQKIVYCEYTQRIVHREIDIPTVS